ncbi:hypothetical protein DFS34DRAFT_692961 [Phlyctochytrium arcticum]|nr:hypothetical protein DFS34DRAFT_692961 [Phlyctochytrium arcticum]
MQAVKSAVVTHPSRDPTEFRNEHSEDEVEPVIEHRILPHEFAAPTFTNQSLSDLVESANNNETIRDRKVISRSATSVHAQPPQVENHQRRIKSLGVIRTANRDDGEAMEYDGDGRRDTWDSDESEEAADKRIQSGRSHRTKSTVKTDPSFLDNVIFPGYKFDPDAPSQEGFGYEALNDLSSIAACLANPIHEAQAVLEAMSREEREEYERCVLAHRWSNSRLSTFKGKEEMKRFKANLAAKRRILMISQAITAKEQEYLAKENEIAIAREDRAEASARIPEIDAKLMQVAQQVQKWKIEKRLPNLADPRHSSNLKLARTNTSSDDAIITADPVLRLFPEYNRFLKKRQLQEKILLSTQQTIPILERQIYQIQSDYLTLLARYDELRAVDEQVHEMDVIEAAENTVMGELAETLKRRKVARQNRLEQRQREEQEEMVAERAERDAIRHKVIDAAREKLRIRLKETVERTKRKNLQETAERTAKAEREQQSMKLLLQEIAKIRTSLPKPVVQTIVDDGSADPAQHALGLLRKRYDLAKRQAKKLQREREHRKILILHRLLQESDRVNREKAMRPSRKRLRHMTDTSTPKSKKDPIKKVATGHVEDTDKMDVESRDSPSPQSDSSDEQSVAEVEPRRRIPLIAPKIRPKEIFSTAPEKQQPGDEGNPLKLTAFVATPSKIVFKDYSSEQDTPLEQHITFTNTSCRTNSIKIDRLELQLQDAFEVEWSATGPPGRLGAGKTCTIIVRFHPNCAADKDIEGSLKLLVEHGQSLDVKIGCLTKKCIPVLSEIKPKNGDALQGSEHNMFAVSGQPVVAAADFTPAAIFARGQRRTKVSSMVGPAEVNVVFGPCYPGDQITRVIRLSNKGALSTSAEIKSLDRDTLLPSTKSSPFSLQIPRDQEDLELAGYGDASFLITFNASKREEIEEKFYDDCFGIYFPDFPEYEPLLVTCIAKIDVLPVTANLVELDLGLCLVDRWQSSKIVLRNASKTAIKICSKVDAPAGDFVPERKSTSERNAPDEKVFELSNVGTVKLSPGLSFLQPMKEPFQTHVKINPSRQALSLLQSQGTNNFELFIKYTYSLGKIWRCVPVKVRGQITISDIEVSLPGQAKDASKPLLLDFGKCSTFDKPSRVKVQIQNNSAISQNIRLSSSHPQRLTISGVDEKGESELRLMESRIYEVTFRPAISDVELCKTFSSMAVICQQLTFSQCPPIRLPCQVILDEPAVHFDVKFNTLNFPSPAIGSQSTQSVHLVRPWTIEEERQQRDANIRRHANEKRISHNQDQNLFDPLLPEIRFSFGSPRIVEVNGSSELAAQQSQFAVDGMDLSLFGKYFTVQPSKGVLCPGEKVPITITFAPPHTPQPPHVPFSGQDEKPRVDLENTDSNGSKGASQGSNRDDNTFSHARATDAPKQKGNKDKPRTRQTTSVNLVPDPKVLESPGTAGLVEADVLSAPESIPDGLRKSLLKSLTNPDLTLLIPCSYVYVYKDNRAQQQKNVNSQAGSEGMVYMRLETKVVSPEVGIVDASAASFAVDFGRVPVGETLVKELRVRNLTDQEATLKELTPPSEETSFRLVDEELPVLPPRGEAIVRFVYSPKHERHSGLAYMFGTKTTQLKVNLAGQGVVPKIDFEEISVDNLFFGDICLGENATRSIKLRNNGEYAATCEFIITLPEDETATTTIDKVNGEESGIGAGGPQGPFTVDTREIVIAPDESYELELKFLPMKESDHFFAYFHVKVWGIPESKLRLKLLGRCWATTTAVFGYDAPPESMREGPFDIPPILFLAQSQEEQTSPARISLVSMTSEDEDDIVPSPDFPPSPMATPIESHERPSTSQLRVDLEDLRPLEMEQLRYATLKCEWYQYDGAWEIRTKDLTVANLKPPENSGADAVAATGGGAGQGGKKKDKNRGGGGAPVIPAEFVLDPSDQSFKYYESLGVFLPHEHGDAESEGDNSKYKFFLEPTEGTLEPGSTRLIRLGVEEAGSPRKRTPDSNSLSMENSASSATGRAPTASKRGNKKTKGGEIAAPMPVEPSNAQQTSLRASAPVYIEQCFRMTLNGGVTIIDAQTAVPSTENRVWIIKVFAQPPATHQAAARH